MKINWIIENMLAHSRYPYARDQLDDLYKKGIRAIVSLVNRRDEDKYFIKEKGFEYLEESVKDCTAPTIDQLIRINKFIDSMINIKKPVLVHCIAGGRSGTVLVSYQIHHGKTFDDSLSEVRDKIKGAVAVNCPPQEEILKKFEMYVREK
ncbi:MAG: dual specificity protein phosphatase family protein [Methanophagales archaeon]|nr:dual specificity protein phosphatase family protein [Methanophagales archaeon]